MTAVSDAPTPSSFDSAVFRTVIGTVTSGVMVLTSRDDDGDHGMTISAVSRRRRERRARPARVRRRSQVDSGRRHSRPRLQFSNGALRHPRG